MSMRALSVSLAAAALVWSAAAFAADPVGTYDVEGTNPGGGSSYRGTVTVDKTGETYRVVWVVGSTRYVGTGIGNRDFIAVSYKSGDSTGLAMYGSEGGNWTGIWTYANGRQIGAEKWSRR
jgi:hypothetical protein